MQKAECRMQNAECRMQNAQTASIILPSAYFCILHSAFCILPSAFCLLPSAFCILPSGQTGQHQNPCQLHRHHPDASLDPEVSAGEPFGAAAAGVEDGRPRDVPADVV